MRVGHGNPLFPLLFTLTAGVALLQLATASDRLLRWAGWTPLLRPGYTDFGSYYVYARMGLHAGWHTLYDLAVQRQEWLAMGGPDVVPWYPMIYPPPLAWLVAPFALLPFPLAVSLWGALIVALFLLMWKLTVPGGWLHRGTYLAAALGLFPVIFGLLLAQVIIVVLAAVVVSWWLLSNRRDVLAGLVLVVLVIKPQVAFLVPFALLASGRVRTFATWALGTAGVSAAAVLSIGGDGLGQYVARLAEAAAAKPEFVVFPGISIPLLVGHGFVAFGLQLAVAALAIRVAHRWRGEGPEVPVIAGLLGSILVAPYLHLQDLTVLVVAVWISVGLHLSGWRRWLPMGGYLLMVAWSFDLGRADYLFSAALLLLEIVWLASWYRVPTSAGTGYALVA